MSGGILAANATVVGLDALVAEMTASSLFLGLLFGSIGFAFFVYGKKQSTLVPLLCGLTLMAVPYFITNTWLLFLVGAVLVVIPYFSRA